jgi:hypothetical protein
MNHLSSRLTLVNNPIFKALLLLIFLPHFQGRIFASDDLVDSVRREVSDSEFKLNNLRVMGESFQEEWAGKQVGWKDAGGATVTGWYTGLPGSKFRIDYKDQIARMGDGPADVFHNAFDISYDGRVSMHLQMQTGTLNDPIRNLIGTIELQRGDATEQATGWSSSLFGFFDKDGVQFSTLISSANGFSATRELRNRIDIIKLVRVRQHGPTDIWYLDPKRGMAILAYEHVLSTGIKTKEFEADTLVQSAPGIFYPKHGVWTYPHPKDGSNWLRVSFKLSDVVANDLKFDDGVFTIHFPIGAVIADGILHISYAVDYADQEAISRIQSQAFVAHQAAATQPATTNSISRGPERPLALPDNINSNSHTMIIISGIGLAAVLALILILAYKGRKTHV